MRQIITDIFYSFAQMVETYVHLMFQQPLNLWINYIIIGLTIAVAYLLCLIGLSAVARNIVQIGPHEEVMYRALWRFRDGRDALSSAIDELRYIAGYYRPLSVGKTIIMQWVPPDFPDPADAKVLLAEAIKLLDGKRFDLAKLYPIQSDLPRVIDITQYRGAAVDDTTFRQERTEIYSVKSHVIEEIRELEQRLPRHLVWIEKLILWTRVLVMGVGVVVVIAAGVTLTVQAIVFGLQLLV